MIIVDLGDATKLALAMFNKDGLVDAVISVLRDAAPEPLSPMQLARRLHPFAPRPEWPVETLAEQVEVLILPLLVEGGYAVGDPAKACAINPHEPDAPRPALEVLYEMTPRFMDDVWNAFLASPFQPFSPDEVVERMGYPNKDIWPVLATSLREIVLPAFYDAGRMIRLRGDGEPLRYMLAPMPVPGSAKEQLLYGLRPEARESAP